MSTTLKQTADKALHLGKQLKAVIEVGEVLDRLGDLELAQIEMEAATKVCREEHAQAYLDLNQVQADLRDQRAQVDAAKAEVIRILAEGTMARDQLLAQARATRDDMIASTTKSTNALVADVNAKIHSLHEKRDSLFKEVTDAQQAVTNLERQMKALKERLG